MYILKNLMMKPKKGDRGFTLVELLVGLVILVIVVGTASMAIITIMRLSPRNTDWAVALRQVQNSGFWISRDVMMARDITVGSSNPTFLTLVLPQAAGVDDKTVLYQFEDMPGGLKRLMRSDNTTQILIAEYISLADDGTTADYNSDNRTLNLTITAVSGDIQVTKDYISSQRVPAASP
jgi:prepilin-type N-terminal cleavage/methylation domain-containing protein